MSLKLQLEQYLSRNHDRHRTKWLSAREPDLWAAIVKSTNFLPENAKPKQRIWHITNDIWAIPLCPTDNIPLKWFDNRYLTYSSGSAKCRNWDYINNKVSVQRNRKEKLTGKPLSARQEYRLQAKRLTNYTWRRFKTLIPNYNLRGRDFHLDHKFSIDEGLKQGVDLQLISHWCNLCIIPAQDNRKKLTKCSITLEELIALVKLSTR